MKFACELLTEEEEGAAARIPFDTFASLYTYLAQLDGEIPPDQTTSFLDSLQTQAYVPLALFRKTKPHMTHAD